MNPVFRCSVFRWLLYNYPILTFLTFFTGHSITDDLISWNPPSNPKCDAMKSTVQELYKVTPMQHPGPGPFSPLTPIGNFSFMAENSSGGRPASISTPVDTNAPAFPQPRTVFPTVNKLNRLEYNLAQSTSMQQHPSLQYHTIGSKFGTPFSGGKSRA